MDDSQKRNFAFGILIAVLIISSIFFFLFTNFLNKGTIQISENSKISAPFSVFEQKSGMHICEQLPCEFKVFAGNKDLLFQKNAYKDKTITTKVSFLRTSTIDLDMNIEAYLELSDLKLETPSNPYRLISDEKTGIQKLVNLKSPIQEAIAFFPDKVENPEYFNSENFLLILDKNKKPILINIVNGEKLYIDSIFQNASDIVISSDGKFFAFNDKEKGTIQFYKTQNKELHDTEIQSQNSKFIFSSDNDLFIVKSDWSKGDYPFYIGKIFSSDFSSENIYEDDAIPERVEQIFVTESGQDLFIKTKTNLYRLVLKLF